MSLLQSKQLFRLVVGEKLHPTSPGDKQDEWDDQQEQAAGLLAQMVERQLHHHFKDYRSDPVRIWDILKRENTAVALLLYVSCHPPILSTIHNPLHNLLLIQGHLRL